MGRPNPLSIFLAKPTEGHFVLGSSLILFTSIKEPDMAELKSDLLAAKEEIAALQTEKKESVRLNP